MTRGRPIGQNPHTFDGKQVYSPNRCDEQSEMRRIYQIWDSPPEPGLSSERGSNKWVGTSNSARCNWSKNDERARNILIAPLLLIFHHG